MSHDKALTNSSKESQHRFQYEDQISHYGIKPTVACFLACLIDGLNVWGQMFAVLYLFLNFNI
jgi:hypothetical protein